MGILFKTYNGKHQLHLYRECWVVKNKAQMDEILTLFSKKEVAKAVITPKDDSIEIEFNGMIVDCRDSADLKQKFGVLADLKAKYQKLDTQFEKKAEPKVEQKSVPKVEQPKAELNSEQKVEPKSEAPAPVKAVKEKKVKK